MDESPEIRVDTLQEAHNRAPGSKPAYVAALFKGTLTKWPEARLRIAGGSFLANEVERSLVMLGVPPGKIELLPIDASKLFSLPSSPVPSGTPLIPPVHSVGISILYRPALKRTVSMQFKPDSGDPPVDVQFEVSPDGKEIEVGAQVAVLKGYIKKYVGTSSSDPAGRDRILTIKIATKVVGLAQFDIGTQNQVAITLKAKIKEAIYLEIAKGVTVEFYGAALAKYDTEKNKAKVGTDFGVGLTITWD
jgi:hypothetical protein